MLFNSPEFLAFCAIVYGLYLVLKFRPQNFMLLIASYVFYAWWDVRFLFLLALSTTVDYWVGLMIENGRLLRNQWLFPAIFLIGSSVVFLGLDLGAVMPSNGGFGSVDHLVRLAPLERYVPATIAFAIAVLLLFRHLQGFAAPRRRLYSLMVSLITQIGLLGIFKYYNFFAESLAQALHAFGISSANLRLDIVLPVGISFYTFQSLSYTIDIYRRQFKPTPNFLDFALFVAYFPQVQAGPIERARQLLPQIARPRTLTWHQLSEGAYLVLFGFLKKVAIADGVSPVVDQVFNSSGHVSWTDVVVATVLFAVQIYCDFSGYTDIARGVSKWFGIELVLNFNQPYFATNPQDFWRRWHISLSTWLRDYLYVPLGGNRGGLWYICRNLLITMLIGGLWHGAAWNFILWGLYQGIALCIYRVWSDYRSAHPSTPVAKRFAISVLASRVIAHVVFLIVTCYGWLLFRAHSYAQVRHFTGVLLMNSTDLDYAAGPPRLSALLGMALLLLLELIQFRSGSTTYYQKFPAPARGFMLASILATIVIGMSNDPAQFIYFQF
jgi:alginate O-acetyltransferase complex protein AlgI